jgi:hypothetical protein
MKVSWLNISYCRNNYLLSIVSVPKTQVLWCEPVVVTIGIIPFGSHNFLLMSISCTNMDSSCVLLLRILVGFIRGFPVPYLKASFSSFEDVLTNLFCGAFANSPFMKQSVDVYFMVSYSCFFYRLFPLLA